MNHFFQRIFGFLLKSSSSGSQPLLGGQKPKATTSKMAPEFSEYGDESFTDERIQESGLLDDIKALGPDSGQDILALIEEVVSKGKPYDDRSMVVS